MGKKSKPKIIYELWIFKRAKIEYRWNFSADELGLIWDYESKIGLIMKIIWFKLFGILDVILTDSIIIL